MNPRSKNIVQFIALIAHEERVETVEIDRFIKLIVPASSRVNYQETSFRCNKDVPSNGRICSRWGYSQHLWFFGMKLNRRHFGFMMKYRISFLSIVFRNLRRKSLRMWIWKRLIKRIIISFLELLWLLDSSTRERQAWMLLRHFIITREYLGHFAKVYRWARWKIYNQDVR